MIGFKKRTPFIYTSILYLGGFFLFMEWLYPAVEVGETGNFNLFIIYAAFCFFISLLQVKWWLSFLFKGTSLLIIINRLFYEEAFLQIEWVQPFINETSQNISALIARDWFDLSNLFRSVLFLLLIWMMSYLIHYWFLEVKRILLFIIMTFIYIGVLDTFTTYDATIPIIRVFILSFISLAMVNLYKEIIKESLNFNWLKKSPTWAIPIILIVLTSTVIGYETPHFKPQWDDPVPFIVSKAIGNNSKTGIQKTGYGEDDSRLGGSFIQDHTPVFQARTNKKYYYRIETKDIYTGKGWEYSDTTHHWMYDSLSNFYTFYDHVEVETEQVDFSFQEPVTLNKIVYPYGIKFIRSDSDDIGRYSIDEFTESIQAYDNKKVLTLSDYSVSFDNPIFDVTALRDDGGFEPPEYTEQYTQVPESLPNRVVEMAEDITREHDNRYDKAKAIEQYFGKNGFVYQTKNIPVPKEEEDYVDQFLFDSQVGYCDNYSTSMVVMLRSVGIPARWVKGFTGGEKISTDDTDGNLNTYQVTNANAHSWVEVFFSETGWVPFEPTQGFNNDSTFDDPTADLNSDEDTDLAPDELNEPEEDEREFPEEEEAVAVPDNDDISVKSTSVFQINTWVISAAMSLLLLLIGIIYLYRSRYIIKTKYLFNKYQNHLDESAYLKLYDHVLHLLSYRGLAIQPNQTLREYATEVDKQLGTENMIFLTRIYEEILYNNQVEDLENAELVDLFKSMIDHIMSKESKHKI